MITIDCSCSNKIKVFFDEENEGCHANCECLKSYTLDYDFYRRIFLEKKLEITKEGLQELAKALQSVTVNKLVYDILQKIEGE